MSWLLLAVVTAFAQTPSASSELKDSEGVVHRAGMAFDGLLTTGWAEGDSGDGDGSWLELKFRRPTQVGSVSIWPGNLESGVRSAREHGRPHTVTVTLTVSGEEVSVEARILDPAEEGPLRVDVPISGKATAVRVTLDKTYSGGIRSDTYIAEVAVNFDRGDVPGQVIATREWTESDAGQAAGAASREDVDALYTEVKNAEFGDRDALREIMDRAADSAPYLRRKARSVPAGFRMLVLPPELAAIEALLKLKDSNAIPALQLAATRSTGSVQEELQDRVGMFQAYQDLVGGPSLNVPAFGRTGFSPGELQGLGEPLAIAVDEYGGAYVADLGNNRVQRFGFNGISEQVWGSSEAGIANQWLEGKRDWYASGSKPGEEKPGTFLSPVDVAVIPGKTEDVVYVLDATARVQRLLSGGQAEVVYTLDTRDPISGGVGGEGYLLNAKGTLVAIWGNEGYAFTPEGEAVSEFKLVQGVPGCAVALKKKVALCYDDELVEFSMDGFRYGDVLGGTLPGGFEAWDATTDEKGKLWVVTDNGWLVKYKKPGKIDYQVKFTDYNELPRFDVYDDIVLITSGDAIQKVDALELAAKADEGS